MSRLLRVAAREYISYVRTVGFWMSLVLMPVVLAVSAMAPLLVSRTTATPRLVIVDLTGEGIGAELATTLRGQTLNGQAQAAGAVRAAVNSQTSLGGRRPFVLVSAPPAAEAAPDAATAGAILRPIMARSRADPKSPDRIDVAAVLSGHGQAVGLDLWTQNLVDNQLENRLRGDLEEVLRHKRLMDAGVRPEVIAAADQTQARVTVYSPQAAGGGKVAFRDRLPAVAGVVMGVLLWSVIFTGAGLLLNSVIEEKGNRILEVLLSSASVPEIMGGKILGGAGVTATVLGVWASVAAAVVASRFPALGADILSVLVGKGLIAYFAVYLVVGYLMYASIFAAVGAFCETSRDAQTLLGPIMLILTVPIIFMGQAIQHPDTSLLQVLSWIPPFTPFLMLARAASDPPAWQVGGSLALMIATTTVVVWLSGRAFRAGALSVGKIDRKAVLGAFIGRRA
jgi:ABC-2 type transport system permease protein